MSPCSKYSCVALRYETVEWCPSLPEIDSSSLSRLGVATGGNETFIGHRGVRTAERVSGEYDTALNFGVRLVLK